MNKRFVDANARRAYIVSLTEVIAGIFEVTDNDGMKAIFLELDTLDDEALIEKQKYVEEYFQDIIQFNRKTISKMTRYENEEKEAEEKENLSPNFNF